MKIILSSKGANLHMVQVDTWIFDDHSGLLFDGSFKTVVGYMVDNGFKMQDIELAVNEMMKNNHDSASFGMFKGFIFTYDRKDRKKVANGN